MLGHKTVVYADLVGACRRLGLGSGLCEHRTEDRHESQPQVAQYTGAWVHLICALWVHCNHPEPSQSEVCLSPAALRDPTRAVSWLEAVFYHPLMFYLPTRASTVSRGQSRTDTAAAAQCSLA